MNEGYKILIVEDEFTIALNLQSILANANYRVLGIADSFKSCVEECKKERPDLILMDIQIKGAYDGIETASLIKDMFGIPVIFITAFGQEDFFERAKILGPEAYITKPFDTKSLLRTIAIACEKISLKTPSDTKNLILNSGDGWVKVAIEDIVYVMSDNNYCSIYLEREKPLLINITLKAIEQQLPRKDFFRCHQSYLLSMQKIKKIERDDGYFAIMDEGSKIPISRVNRSIMLEKFKQYNS